MRFVLTLILFIPCFASARVFDFNKETIAAYLRGTGVLSQVGNKAYSRSSGASTNFSDSVKYNFGGEFGVMFGLGSGVNLRLGLELYQTKPMSTAKGENAAGAELMDVKSTVFSFAPMGTVEVVVSRGASHRIFVSGGMGYANVTMENAYTFTTLGTSTYSVANYTEKSEASSIFGTVGVGLETEFADATTLAFDVGYRYFPVSKFTYKGDVTTLQGAKTKGGTVVNGDGSTRSLDLGGLSLGVALRFYIDLI